MMETTDLTSDALAALRARRPYPAVTVVMPTHRREPNNTQDLVRLRNLLADAKHRLESDPEVPREARFDIGGELDRAASEIDLSQVLDSLVIFAAREEHQIWYLAHPAPERVVLSDSFLTRHLVAARERADTYWVLAVDADRATLWSGTDSSLVESRSAGFPMEPERIDTAELERRGRVGDVQPPLRDERTSTYLRQVDAALMTLLSGDSYPLYLVGLAPVLSLLEEMGTAARLAAGKVVKGGLTNGPASVLVQALRPALEAHADHRVRRVEEQFDQAKGRKAFAAGLDEVWQVVQEGRIELLAVEEGYQQTVRVSEEHLQPVDPLERGPAAAGAPVRDDIVDEVIETALATSSEVAFVPDGTLAAHGRIAAALRF